MTKRLLAALVFMGACIPVWAQGIQLISESEAGLPSAGVALTRAITRGPGVRLVTPESVTRAGFPLRILFEPRGGSKIDVSSVRITYLRKPEVDLTSRIKNAIRPDGIDVASATAPAGEHAIRITLADDEGRQGSSTIILSVK